jgi:hypothetical protein
MIFISGRSLFYLGELGVVGGYNFRSEAILTKLYATFFWHYFALLASSSVGVKAPER